MKTKPKVAFIRVHNSCRSQIAEALGRHFASDIFESYSAGTEKTGGWMTLLEIPMKYL